LLLLLLLLLLHPLRPACEQEGAPVAAGATVRTTHSHPPSQAFEIGRILLLRNSLNIVFNGNRFKFDGVGSVRKSSEL